MIFSAAFGGAYGFISGSRSEISGYDPNAFAIGVSFLFALACVALATLSIRLRLMREKMRKIALHNEAHGRSQLGIAGSRAARPQPVRIAGRSDRAARRRRPHHLRQRRLLRTGGTAARRADRQPRHAATCSNRATPRWNRTARAFTTRRSRARWGRAGSPGAKGWSATTPAARRRCKASAATSPIAPKANARWPRPATRPMRRTAPSRASSRWRATRSARR